MSHRVERREIVQAEPIHPPRDDRSCIRKTVACVADFFVRVAKCIWGAITWTCAKLASICCCLCARSDDDVVEEPLAPPREARQQVYFGKVERRNFDRDEAPNGSIHDSLHEDDFNDIPDRGVPPDGQPALSDEWRAIMAIPDLDAAPDDLPPIQRVQANEQTAPKKEGVSVDLKENEVEIEVKPLNEMEVINNRADALKRLAEIKDGKIQFKVHELRILGFDLDQALLPFDISMYHAEMPVAPGWNATPKQRADYNAASARYRADAPRLQRNGLKAAGEFVALLDWAAPGFKDRENFKQIVEEMHGNYGAYHPELVELTQARFRKIFVMIDRAKKALDKTPNAKKEKDLKTLIRNTAIRMNFALNNGNCIVQTNSQTANICTSVLAGTTGNATFLETIQLNVGNAVYAHKNNLIKKVVDLQTNPDGKIGVGHYEGGGEVYTELALRKAIADDKPNNNQYAYVDPGVKIFKDLFTQAPVGTAVDERPLGFLMRALADPYGANLNVGHVRDDLRSWANHYFNLVNEDGEVRETDEEAKTILKLLSGKTDKGEDGDAFTVNATADHFSREGALFLLEEAGCLELIK